MDLVFISDTHSRHGQMSPLPLGDVLIHAGDFTASGCGPEIESFIEWMREQPHQHKVVIAGNHDWDMEEQKYQDMMNEVAHYLHDSSVVIDGTKFYGSPWQPSFCSWAFNLPRLGEELREKWELIPDDTDVLITHGPCHEVLDLTTSGERAGCELLRDRVLKVSPKIHVFGHIHEGYGVDPYGLHPTISVNPSICTVRYQPTNKPIVVEI